MKNFETLSLSDDLNQSLEKMGYKEPTPIQQMAIPFALKGKDILGSAQTGTGKTAAFAIPMVESIMREPLGTALVLTPTRELAKQVLDVVKQLIGKRKDIRTAFIIGGEPMGKQFAQLKDGARIIVGTPGRINDHLDRGSLKLDQTNFLVLDETDRMLDMGFGIQLDQIVKFLPKERQTLMFSATLPNGIIKLSNKYLSNPERVAMGQTNVVAKNIKQEILKIEQPRKYDELVNQLHDRKGSVIVFVKTKHSADRIAKNLRRDDVRADALHGDLRQNKRDRVMKNFRDQKFRVLIATDIASRGLDVPHIEHVINYDLPQVPEDYIHRMGRTARAGAEGSALCFIASHDTRLWNDIECMLNPDLKQSNNSRNRKGKGGPKKKGRFDNRKSSFGRGQKPSFKSDKPRDEESGFKKDRSRNDRSKFKKSNSGNEESGFKKDRSRNERSDSRNDKPREERSFRKDKPAFKGGKPSFKDGNDSDRRTRSKSNAGGRPEYRKSKSQGKPQGKTQGKTQGNKNAPNADSANRGRFKKRASK